MTTIIIQIIIDRPLRLRLSDNNNDDMKVMTKIIFQLLMFFETSVLQL